MTAYPLIAAMLAGRRSLNRANPDLLTWSRRQWDAWFLDQRRTGPYLTRPKLVVVAALSCLDDLLLHVGLMQLLGLAGYAAGS